MNSAELPDPEGKNTLMLLTPDMSPAKDEDIRKNKKYYLDDDPMAIFLVGNQGFRVHRYYLRTESDIFNLMFLCPPGADGPDGCSDERAIPLPDVAPAEFEALCDFFYDEKFQCDTASTREWINLLAISTRFDFRRLRERAITALEHGPNFWHPRGDELDPIEQIVLAEKYDIPHWLRIAYVKICERSEALETWEAEKIGPHKTALLARARETVRNPHHHTPPPPQPPTGAKKKKSSAPPSIPAPEIETPSNGFYHDRHRVNTIVSEVFFPAGNA
ncbi:BTB domain-containing protein [Mycena sanguinolenta]|uniref:BTB domain-containing protein n=1 Tax=Mycena sanguinolenta TaxID=230812 RepID=A0A8H6YY82_9AGAR|nr:BTB domain-containing protein [Mycena sanguinolenta]